MNKTELLKEISKDSGIDVNTVRIVFNSMGNVIYNSLLFGIDIKIKDFLNFTILTSPEKRVWNVLKGEHNIISKRYRVRVSLPRSFKEKMSKKPVY